jgi:hypothetical protein
MVCLSMDTKDFRSPMTNLAVLDVHLEQQGVKVSTFTFTVADAYVKTP